MAAKNIHERATLAIIAGRHAEAEAVLSSAISADPNDGHAHMLLGRLAEARQDPATTLRMLKRAIELEPDNGEYHALLGRTHARLNAMTSALACADQALSCADLSDLALDALAAIYTQVGNHQRAAELLTRAVSAGTRNAAIHMSLGSSLKFLGDFAGARRALEGAIELAPLYYKAHAALTALGGISQEHNHLPRLRALVAENDDPHERIHLCHAAAKECETLGLFDEAWELLNIGKVGLRAALGDAARSDQPALFDAVRHAFTTGADRATLHAGCRSKRPIFIVGMPRSGTTVLDRILSNHSEIVSIGESLAFPQQIKLASGSRSPNLLDVAVIGALAQGIDLGPAGTDYVAHGAALSKQSPRFVDKFHLNFMLAGHILRALPEARILCLVRDPLDTIVSNYRQLFEFASPLYRYSLDLDATTEFTISFRRLADFWSRNAPDRFRIVPYEQLVLQPEDEARGILEFCGLDWEDGCTAIERNQTPIATASAVQVREKINARSIGAWRSYDRFLAPVRQRLTEAGLTNIKPA